MEETILLIIKDTTKLSGKQAVWNLLTRIFSVV